MRIRLSPQCRDEPLVLIRSGDTLVVNGETFDFTPLPDGATLPRDAIDSEFFVSDVSRVEGKLDLTLLLPHGPDAPEQTRFPEPIMDPPDGVVALPPFTTERPESDDED